MTILVYPDQQGYRDLPCIPAGFLATKWGCEVVDLNTASESEAFLADSYGHAFVPLQSRAWAEAERLATVYPRLHWRSVQTPIPGMCCFKYLPWARGNLFENILPPVPNYRRFTSYQTFLTHWRSGAWPYALFTSWGCPYACNYCAARRTGWTPRHYDHLSREVDEALAQGVKWLTVVDDCMNVKPAHALRVCEVFREVGVKQWACTNGLRADRLTEPAAAAMAASGCHTVGFGIETSDDALLRAIDKGETCADIERGLKIAKDHFDSVSGYLILGLPGSSYDIDRRTIEWGIRQGVYLHLSFHVPEVAGTTAKNQVFYGDAARAASQPGYPAELQERLQRETVGLSWGSAKNWKLNLAGRVRILRSHGPRACASYLRMDWRKIRRRLTR